jgi:hypothetical protein
MSCQDYAKALYWLHRAEASGNPQIMAAAKKWIPKVKQAQAAQNSGQ